VIVVGNLFVPGHPKTKGSLTIVPGRRCRCCPACQGYVGKPHAKDTPASGAWRKLMAYQLRARARDRPDIFPLVGPVAVYALWVLAGDVITTGAGDKDKLDRNLFDALTDAGVYADDVQVVDGRTMKIRGDSPGVGICVVAL
jgi:Holliday junction resolvase RusA-like endonuclease